MRAEFAEAVAEARAEVSGIDCHVVSRVASTGATERTAATDATTATTTVATVAVDVVELVVELARKEIPCLTECGFNYRLGRGVIVVDGAVNRQLRRHLYSCRCSCWKWRRPRWWWWRCPRGPEGHIPVVAEVNSTIGSGSDSRRQFRNIPSGRCCRDTAMPSTPSIVMHLQMPIGTSCTCMRMV